MATYPVKARKRVPEMLRTDEVAVVEPARTRFFSFRYSFTEVSLVGGRTRVKSRQARFEGAVPAVPRLSNFSFLERGPARHSEPRSSA